MGSAARDRSGHEMGVGELRPVVSESNSPNCAPRPRINVSESADLYSILSGPALTVAPLLLGSVVRHHEVAVRICEVEAYDGANDPASHAFRGRTRRNDVMFGPAGLLYVYLSYGMHHCCNVVCGPVGSASAVLLRAGEVIEGRDVAQIRRPRSSCRDLARGPGRLCQSLGIDLAENGVDLSGDRLTLQLAEALPSGEIQRGPRVGVRNAAGRHWRFWIAGDRHVTSYRSARS